MSNCPLKPKEGLRGTSSCALTRILLQSLLPLLGMDIVEPYFISITDALGFAATTENASGGQFFEESCDAFEH